VLKHILNVTNMLKTIVRKEILEQLINLRFIVLIFICITIIPLSFFVSYQDYMNCVSDYNRSLQLNQENLDNIKMSEVFTGEFSIKGYRPPSPLSIFASGLGEVMPEMLVAKKTGLTFQKSSSENVSVMTTIGKIDFMFIVLIIFSLMAILFTFDAVCGEKERGTLGATLSNPLPRDVYILGKYLGTMITLLLPFIVSLIIGLILLIVLGYPLFSSELLIRIVLIIIISIIFISIFTSIGLFISSRVKSSKTSIVILLLIWIIMVFVIPKGSDIVAKAFIPVDSEAVVQLEKSLLIQNLELEKGKRIDEVEKTFPQLDMSDINGEKNKHIYEERNKILIPIRNEYNRKISEGINRIDEKFTLEKERQYSTSLLLARISPVTPFNQITTNLSWTGEHTRKKFITSAQSFQTILNQAIFDNIYRDISPKGRISMGISSKINLKELPTYNFERVSLWETSKSIVLDVGLLFFFLIFFFMLSYISFLKYDVR